MGMLLGYDEVGELAELSGRRRTAERTEVLEEQRHAERRDQGRQPGLVAQWAIRQFLHDEAKQASNEHGRDDRRDKGATKDLGHDGGKEESHVGADHENVSMSEVDEAHDAVHHRVAQGDQGVDAADLDAVDELLQELAHVFSSNRRRSGDVPGSRCAEMRTRLRVDGRQVRLLPFLILMMTAALMGLRLASNL